MGRRFVLHALGRDLVNCDSRLARLLSESGSGRRSGRIPRIFFGFGRMQAETATFERLISRVGCGDAEACTQLVHEYGEVIIRVARRRLGDAAVRAVLDEEDVRQSVFRSFFRRAADGKFVISDRRQLKRLLAVMARNKSVDRVRAASRLPRAAFAGAQQAMQAAVDQGPSPAEVAADRDELAAIQRTLPATVCRFLNWRLAGHSWTEIAEFVGERADTVRKRLRRALSDS